ncbi:hypothetical protein TVAG_254480 [Trichomonas vaginalis G3]|uniref:Leucine Rich Repeat family protein n=1 Tax=Trichomonas vaginalis (strain ATCC PRA-98 / G3) TaxID=412133 RepID=A2DMW5_TRIV3|nr:leucine-rich repeat, isoform f-related family [Trichomonas vaginalis G3]EAY18336.1 hypothetical protein TVAG_254480 [Trichomonas vaginalis G3]KAI5541833.1 leucine-rich repeat, isoform f-related family [Trichomonas vaginalis G3]|eukprot:XP_001579322.1 hypothetical protein [Trichomonas vaginalis G3]
MEADLIEQAKKYCQEKTQEAILFADIVEKYNDNNDHHQPRICVATENRIALFKGKTKIEFSRERYWVDITKLVWNEEIKRVDFIFKMDQNKKLLQVRFSSNKAAEYRTIVADYLARILPPIQMKEANVQQFVTHDKKAVAISAVKRLEAYSFSRKVEIPANVKREFFEIIQNRYKKVRLPGTDKEHGFLIAALQADPSAEHLVLVGNETEDLYSVVAVIPSGYSPFTHITLDTPNTTKFVSMCRSIKLRPNLFQTEGFTFKNSNFDQKLVDRFNEEFNFKKFRALTFNNSFSPEVYDSFVEKVLTEEFCQTIEYFGIENQQGLKVPVILTKVPNVVAISFADNGLELGTVLNDITAANLQNLKAINLANNKCENDTELEALLSENIELIDISGCTFSTGKLVSFLTAVFKAEYKKGLTIMANNLKTSAEELGKALDTLATTRNCSLVGLSWIGNPIGLTMGQLCRSIPQLRILFLDDCFDNNTEPFIVNQIAEALKDLPKFRKLSIRSINKVAGNAILPILKALKSSQSIEYLDVRNQKIGTEGLHAIADIISAGRPLNFLDFDGSKPESYDDIKNIVDLCLNNGQHITISYPLQDVAEFVQTNKEIQGYLTVSLNKLMNYPTEEYDPKDPFTTPFDRFVHQPEVETEFPQFRSRNIVKFFESAEEISEIEIKSPKKGAKKSSSSSSDEYEDDNQRLRNQRDRAAFYLGEGENTTEDNQDDEGMKPQQEQIKLKFDTDDYRDKIDWEDWDPAVLKPFDNSTALQKVDKKYHLDVLREALH